MGTCGKVHAEEFGRFGGFSILGFSMDKEVWMSKVIKRCNWKSPVNAGCNGNII